MAKPNLTIATARRVCQALRQAFPGIAFTLKPRPARSAHRGSAKPVASHPMRVDLGGD